MKITNQKFVRDGVHMLRCWDIVTIKRVPTQVMTEIVNPNPPRPQPKSHCWSPEYDESIFKGRGNTSGVTYR